MPPNIPQSRLADSLDTLASLRRTLGRAALRLEATVLPPDDPRLGQSEARRIDDAFYFGRDVSISAAWLRLERGLAGLVSAPESDASRRAADLIAVAKSAAERHVTTLNGLLDSWSLPPLPPEISASTPSPGLRQLQRSARQALRQQASPRLRAGIEKRLLEWLFSAVKLNVKRQRGYFELGQVLKGYANCLGYARLFQALAPRFGLDCGIADVVIDNAGRYVPHQACLFRFSDGSWRMVDAWYGSTDIKHRRLGLRLKDQGRWLTRDVDASQLQPGVPVAGLRRQEIDAITFYIRGNRHLAQGESGQAIECYRAAVLLYPNDSRPLFNRAVARERLGETEKAKADYARAMKDDSALIRVLATEHNEVTRLIGLDAAGIGQHDQAVYLLSKGFITGGLLPPADVAARCGVAVEEARQIVERVERSIG